MIRRRFVLLAGVLALYAAGVSAEPDAAKSRLCTDGDLMNGTWRLVQLQETPPNREAIGFRHFPNQYIMFNNDYTYSYVRNDVDAHTPDEVKQWLAWPKRQHATLRFTIENNGTLSLYSEKYVLWRYSCLIVTQSGGEFKANDLVLNGYARAAGKTRIYKVYRRWF